MSRAQNPTPRAIPLRVLPLDAGVPSVPTIPTVVIGSFKGGVWKTSVAVAVAERLSLGGLKVLLITTDEQMDARRRLGLGAEAANGAGVARGAGTVHVLGTSSAGAVDILYRQPLGGAYDIAVLDAPPVRKGGALPGVMLIAPTDGDDASNNLILLLRSTPASSEIVLVRVQRASAEEWARDAATILAASDRMDGMYLPTPLPASVAVRRALGRGESVWGLPRHGCTHEYLAGIETLAGLAWERARPGQELPAAASAETSVYIAGWDAPDA